MRDRHKALIAAVCAGALIGAAGGCAPRQPKPVDFSESARAFGPRDYAGVRQSWTRHGQIMQNEKRALELWAVLKSPEFRQAYVERYAEMYSIGDAERRAMLEQQLATSREWYEFHATVQTHDWRWNDLAKKNSPWRVLLVDAAGVEISPASIEIARLPPLVEAELFPDQTAFSTTYAIRFRRTSEGDDGRRFAGADSGLLTLRVLGPVGRTDLVWTAR